MGGHAATGLKTFSKSSNGSRSTWNATTASSKKRLRLLKRRRQLCRLPHEFYIRPSGLLVQFQSWKVSISGWSEMDLFLYHFGLKKEQKNICVLSSIKIFRKHGRARAYTSKLLKKKPPIGQVTDAYLNNDKKANILLFSIFPFCTFYLAFFSSNRRGESQSFGGEK